MFYGGISSPHSLFSERLKQLRLRTVTLETQVQFWAKVISLSFPTSLSLSILFLSPSHTLLFTTGIKAHKHCLKKERATSASNTITE